MKTVVFTGGHHTSALEVAKSLKNKGWNVIWFGHRHSMWGDKADSAEYRDVVAEGIKFYDLKAGKFYNTFNPLKLIRIPWGFIQAFGLLVNLKPAGIVSFGGYLAVPTVICGWLLGIPSITHEQTVVAGWANKLISKFAVKIAVTWPESLSLYPRQKTILTGLPLRSEIVNLKNAKEIKNTVYITGGKQGAHVINQAVFSALSRLTKKYNLIHQTGSSAIYHDYEKAKTLAGSKYKVFDYSSDLAISSLAQAEVVVGRAGAHIIYELGYLGKPCVLIPIPWVSHNEQFKNAQLLQKNNLAVILEENNLSPDTLEESIDKALKLKKHPLNLPSNATSKIVQIIEQQF